MKEWQREECADCGCSIETKEVYREDDRYYCEECAEGR